MVVAAAVAVGMGVAAALGVGVGVRAVCGLCDVLERRHAVRGGYCVCLCRWTSVIVRMHVR